MSRARSERRDSWAVASVSQEAQDHLRTVDAKKKRRRRDKSEVSVEVAESVREPGEGQWMPSIPLSHPRLRQPPILPLDAGACTYLGSTDTTPEVVLQRLALIVSAVGPAAPATLRVEDR